jgi:hypothetical protein
VAQTRASFSKRWEKVGEVVREGVGSKPSQHLCSQAINTLADGYLSVYNRFGHTYLDGYVRRRLGVKPPTQVPYIAEKGLAVLFNPSLSRDELIGALFFIAQKVEALTSGREAGQKTSRGGGKALKASKTEKLSSNKLTEEGGGAGRDE